MASFDIVVPDIADVARSFDRIGVFRSATEGGVFAEITVALTRIPINPTQSIYRFTDDAGAVTNWYKVAYFSTGRNEWSPQSAAFLPEGDAALELIPVAVFKERYLLGLDLTDESGQPYPESLYQHYIRQAFARAEMELGIAIAKKQVTETHDWEPRKWEQWGRVVANKLPILSVQTLKLRFPGASNVLTFDPSWISLRGGRSRTLHVVPQGGISSFFVSGGAWWMRAYHQQSFVPNAFELTYTVGFERGSVPQNIIEVIGKLASIGMLNVLGDLVAGAGLQAWSVSMDGLSESVTTANSSTNAGFGARILNYQKELKREIDIIRDYYHAGDLQA